MGRKICISTQTSILVPLCIFLYLALIGCGGGGGNEAAPPSDVPLPAMEASDTEFDDSNWTSETLLDEQSAGTLKVTQSDSNASTGAFQEVSHEFSGPGGFLSVHLRNGSTFNPSVTGAIGSLSISYNLIALSNSTGEADFKCLPLIEQDGAFYGLSEIGSENAKNEWAHQEYVKLVAEDFILLSESGFEHPDFMTRGAPLNFGYYVISRTADTELTASIGIDDWKLSIYSGKDADQMQIVTIDPKEIAGTGGKILFNGAYTEAPVEVPLNTPVLVKKEEQYFLYNSALRESLTENATLRAVGHFMTYLWQSDAPSVPAAAQLTHRAAETDTDESGIMLKTGIRVERLGKRRIKLTNTTGRFTLVSIGNKSYFLSPPKTRYWHHCGQQLTSLIMQKLDNEFGTNGRYYDTYIRGNIRTIELTSSELELPILTFGAADRAYWGVLDQIKEYYGEDFSGKLSEYYGEEYADESFLGDNREAIEQVMKLYPDQYQNLRDLDVLFASAEFAQCLVTGVTPEEFDIGYNTAVGGVKVTRAFRTGDFTFIWKEMLSAFEDTAESATLAFLKWCFAPVTGGSSPITGEVPLFLQDLAKAYKWAVYSGLKHEADVERWAPFDEISFTDIPEPYYLEGSKYCLDSESEQTPDMQRSVLAAAGLLSACLDGLNNDCDNLMDCNDPDCFSDPSCRSCVPEDCGDLVDNDCDGLIDCEDSDCLDDNICRCVDDDEDGYPGASGCDAPVDCNDDDPNISPDATEIPGDGIDQNCDDNLDVYYRLTSGGSLTGTKNGSSFGHDVNDSVTIDETSDSAYLAWATLYDDGSFIVRIAPVVYHCTGSVSCGITRMGWHGTYSGGSTSGSLDIESGECIVGPDAVSDFNEWHGGSGSFSEDELNFDAAFEIDCYGLCQFQYELKYQRSE